MSDLSQIEWIYPREGRWNGGRTTRWSPRADASDAVMFAPLKLRCRQTILVGFGKSDLFDQSMTEAELDKVLAIMALAAAHDFAIVTDHPDRARRYIEGFDCAWRDYRECKRRITLAVNAVMLGSGRNWGRLGSTSTWITTSQHEEGLPEIREPEMLRKTGDGGVERLIAWRDGEVWSRCGQEFADRMLASWWGRFDAKICWGLKAWRLPNVAIGVRRSEKREAA